MEATANSLTVGNDNDMDTKEKSKPQLKYALDNTWFGSNDPPVNNNTGNGNNNRGMGVPGGQSSLMPPSQQQQPQQQQQYTIPGILHFLQFEWQRFELERQQWEVERAELQARIALLQGICQCQTTVHANRSVHFRRKERSRKLKK